MEIIGLGYVFVFIFGLLIGSFINASAGRWGTSRVNAARSKCWYCGQILKWVNLIPLFSWLYQRGRCSTCKCRISLRYLAIELITASLFVGALAISTSYIEFGFNLLIFSILIFIALVDIDQFIIPHQASIPLALLSFAQLFISPINLSTTIPDAWQLLAGPILALFFWGLWLVTKGKGMGFADGTLALSIGWMLGLGAGITSAILSFWIGTIVSLSLILYYKYRYGRSELGMKSAVPFGPYLIAGFLFVYITGWQLLVW